ncbi:MAG TPA: hypothetical protein VD948_01920 [Rhodothermales bacterium]|nr:hypothetical protein [Rhodothermales bacterium]
MPEAFAHPIEIGPSTTTAATPPEARRRDGYAVVPGRGGEVRAVEMFDATPAVNRREGVIRADNATFRFLRLARILLDPQQ